MKRRRTEWILPLTGLTPRYAYCYASTPSPAGPAGQALVNKRLCQPTPAAAGWGWGRGGLAWPLLLPLRGAGIGEGRLGCSKLVLEHSLRGSVFLRRGLDLGRKPTRRFCQHSTRSAQGAPPWGNSAQSRRGSFPPGRRGVKGEGWSTGYEYTRGLSGVPVPFGPAPPAGLVFAISVQRVQPEGGSGPWRKLTPYPPLLDCAGGAAGGLVGSSEGHAVAQASSGQRYPIPT